jgi:hypothetical protein
VSDAIVLGVEEARTEEERVAFCRFLVLVHAGYPRSLARQVATSGADIHRATSLLAAGCPPPLAVRILL